MTDWDSWLAQHHPELKVPERLVVAVFGPAPWSRTREQPPSHKQGVCSNCGGKVRRGSKLYCPACHKSGFDSQLAYQKHLAGVPKPDPKPRPTRSAKTSGQPNRKQKRAALFQGQDHHPATPEG